MGKTICDDYLFICRAIMQLDSYFFPWNDQVIKTVKDFQKISWPFLKESVDIAHRYDPKDPDSDYIYGVLIESLGIISKEENETVGQKGGSYSDDEITTEDSSRE